MRFRFTRVALLRVALLRVALLRGALLRGALLRGVLFRVVLVFGILALMTGSDRCWGAVRTVEGAGRSLASDTGKDAAPAATALLRAAMEAGGCQETAAIERCLAIFDEFCTAHKASVANAKTDRQRAAILLSDMHQQFLTGSFQPHCYRLDATLGGKSYNCLTSTILFLCLCREFHLPATAIGGPGHVYCRLQSGGPTGGPTDVQTTSANGLGRSGLDTPREATSGGAQESSADASATDLHAADTGELTDRQLLARVYYNRGTSLLRQNEPGRAVRCLQQAHQLHPDSRATRHNLIAAWNDWSLQLCEQQQFAAAAAALQTCLQIDPHNSTTLLNEVHVHHRWVTELCAGHQFDDALSLLNECHTRRPGVAFFDQGRWVVYRDWAATQLASGGWDGARDVFRLAHQRHPDDAEQQQSEALFWSDQLEHLRQVGQHVESNRLQQWLHESDSDLTAGAL